MFTPRYLVHFHIAIDKEFLGQFSPHRRAIFEYLRERLKATGEEIYWRVLGFSFRPEIAGQSVSVVYGWSARSGTDCDTTDVYFPQLEEALAGRGGRVPGGQQAAAGNPIHEDRQDLSPRKMPSRR